MSGNYRPISVRTWALFVQEQHQSYPSPVTSLSLQPSGGRQRHMNSLITDDRPPALQCLSVEALKHDGVNKRSNASMDKSFDGMHEKYDFDSIRCSVKKTILISISMIVTSVHSRPIRLYRRRDSDLMKATDALFLSALHLAFILEKIRSRNALFRGTESAAETMRNTFRVPQNSS